MIACSRHIAVALIYCVAMSWIYLTEISEFWAYMGFVGEYSDYGLISSLALTSLIAALLPKDKDSRGITIMACVYIFFIPAIIFASYSREPLKLLSVILVSFFIISFVSSFKPKAPAISGMTYDGILKIVFGAVVIALAIQAFYGGLQNFNLDIERVYEFRREAASDLPAIFGYVYSSVASVLVPLVLILAIRNGSYWLIAAALASSVILFGMSHHKSVLFGPPTVAMMYYFFQRVKSGHFIAFAFLTIPFIGIIEILYMRSFNSLEPAYLTSLIIRRVLFVPPMLDSLYIEYFSVNPKFLWSTSRIASWFSENNYGVTAPFVIGQEYFGDDDTSSNTGVIGSGFANAGLVGVVVYSIGLGLLIALLNAFGRRIGHPFVAAVGFATIVNVLTSTDLVTAVLTHGLLLLIVVLALFPSESAPFSNSKALEDDRTF